MAFYKTFSIPKGYEVTLTADEFVTVGTYGRVAQPGSGTQYAPSEISASATATVGPFNEDRTYFLSGDNGDISYSLEYSGIFTQDDTTESVLDLVGSMVTGNTETGITVTYQDADNTLDFVVSDEYIQDTVGAMFTGNTETGITVDYQDADGTIDLALSDEYIQDLVGAMTTGNTETGISVDYQAADGTIDFVLDDEYVQDLVGAMVSGNTESGISVTYQDADGTLDFELSQLPSQNAGTAETGTTAVEYGDGRQHTTVLTVSTTLPAIAGGAALSVGKLLYTFPAGSIVVDKAYMSMAITQTQGNITADTPDVGLGTAIAAGANALLSDTAGAENVLTGQTANDCNGTAEVKTVANQILVIEAGDAHTLHFNVADDWAADGDAAALLTGTVVLHWQFMA